MLNAENSSVQIERASRIKAKLLGEALTFAATSTFLLLLDWWTSGGINWAFWPVLGLGYALAMRIGRLLSRWQPVRQGAPRSENLAAEHDLL